MGLFKTTYRFTKEVVATSVDEHEHAVIYDDTTFQPGAEFVIALDRHNWPPHPKNELYYTIRVKDSQYNVRAEALEPAMEKVPEAPAI